MINILVLLPISFLIAGCPIQHGQVVPEPPILHRGHSERVSCVFIRAYMLIERLDGGHSEILRATTRAVRDDRYPITIDVFALFSSAVQFGESAVELGINTFRIMMLTYCEFTRLTIIGESPFETIWNSHRNTVSQIYPGPTRAIQSFQTIIAFMWHPNIPSNLRCRVGSVFRHALLILEVRGSNYDRMLREVIDPLIFIAYNLIWTQRIHHQHILATTEQLQHLYTTMIDIAREGIVS